MRRFNDKSHTSKGHRWSNNPSTVHQICIICGCKKDITYSNKQGKNTFIYTDKYGNILDGCPDCKSINL